MNKVLFSKNTDDWKTPESIYKEIIKNGYIDVAPYESNINYLELEWNYNKIYINPPFSKNKEFIKKAIETQKKYKNEILLLLPARTDTQYFKELFNYGCDFIFIIGRLKYNDKNSAPFPSVFINLNGKENTINYIKRDEIIQCK